MSNTICWKLGTMGYAYDDWAGSFYPPRHPRNRWLEYYSRLFNCVELNTTFHALPTPDRFASWAKAVPDDFRFSIKVGRHITHDQPLEQSLSAYRYFIEATAELGPKRGPLLLQLPPTFHYAQRSALELLLAATPSDCQLAVEFRSATWLRPETSELLSHYRATWVGIDHEDHPQLAIVPVTSSIVYLRLVGKHGRYDSESHELRDPTADLECWTTRLHSANLSACTEVWVLFNNDYAGHAPTTLRRFAQLLNLPLPSPPPQADRQLSLFDDLDHA